MRADEYNDREIAAGRITTPHITALTGQFQAQRGLPVDGKCGPETRAALGLPVENPDLVQIALGDIGRTDAETFRAGGPGRDWCAYWLSSVLERAGLPAPEPGSRARRGARALVRWIADQGEWVIDPKRAAELRRSDAWAEAAKLLQPGDVIAWRASLMPIDWRGHVALIVSAHSDGSIETIGGNESGAVRHARLSVEQWPWRRPGELYAVARRVPCLLSFSC